MNRFTPRQIERARRIKELGVKPPLRPGAYVFEEEGAGGEESLAAPPTPFQEGVHLIVWPDEFARAAGGREAFERRFAWLPAWEDGREWLRAKGVPDKHLYSVVREGVRFYGEDERELLYEEIIRILEIERAERESL